MAIDLSNYVRVGRYDLPTTGGPAGSQLAQEASSVTYDADTDTLFVVGDEGTSIVQVSKTGQLIDSMTLGSGQFNDTEGLVYVGNGYFVMTEERERNAVLFSYSENGTLNRSDAQIVNLGTNVGNVGLEGVTYDPATNSFFFVKEKTPEAIFQTTLNFGAGTSSNGTHSTEATNLFDPAKLGLLDLSDIFALSNVSGVAGTDSGNLLVLSQESGKIVEIDHAGNILSTLTLQAPAGSSISLADMTVEGVTMDAAGNLYVVNEAGGGAGVPQLWVYAPASTTNAAPTALALSNATTSILENTNTSSRIKVADIALTDDGVGNNVFTLTGADAAKFEVDASGLYIKAGTVLDYETKTSWVMFSTIPTRFSLSVPTV